MTTEGWTIIYFTGEGHDGTNKQTKNEGGMWNKNMSERKKQPDLKACELSIYQDPLLKGLP